MSTLAPILANAAEEGLHVITAIGIGEWVDYFARKKHNA
jgi:hypothetical protein